MGVYHQKVKVSGKFYLKKTTLGYSRLTGKKRKMAGQFLPGCAWIPAVCVCVHACCMYTI